MAGSFKDQKGRMQVQPLRPLITPIPQVDPSGDEMPATTESQQKAPAGSPPQSQPESAPPAAPLKAQAPQPGTTSGDPRGMSVPSGEVPTHIFTVRIFPHRHRQLEFEKTFTGSTIQDIADAALDEYFRKRYGPDQ